MKRALFALSIAALLLGGLSLTGCASPGKCCDGDAPCAACRERMEKGCPDCKAAGGMCEKCKAACKDCCEKCKGECEKAAGK